MNKKINLSNIDVSWLNKRALVLISIFAHVAHKEENTIIDLLSEDVLNQVSSLVKSTNNAKLVDLYAHIKIQIKMSVVDAKSNTKTSEQVSRVIVAHEYNHDSINSVAARA